MIVPIGFWGRFCCAAFARASFSAYESCVGGLDGAEGFVDVVLGTGFGPNFGAAGRIPFVPDMTDLWLTLLDNPGAGFGLIIRSAFSSFSTGLVGLMSLSSSFLFDPATGGVEIAVTGLGLGVGLE